MIRMHGLSMGDHPIQEGLTDPCIALAVSIYRHSQHKHFSTTPSHRRCGRGDHILTMRSATTTARVFSSSCSSSFDPSILPSWQKTKPRCHSPIRCMARCTRSGWWQSLSLDEPRLSAVFGGERKRPGSFGGSYRRNRVMGSRLPSKACFAGTQHNDDDDCTFLVDKYTSP